MKRIFNFIWYKNERYRIMERESLITVISTGDIGYDAKQAVEVFCKTFGNLKKNTIISIQEVNEKNEPIGEPIIPMNENSIIPIKK